MPALQEWSSSWGLISFFGITDKRTYSAREDNKMSWLQRTMNRPRHDTFQQFISYFRCTHFLPRGHTPWTAHSQSWDFASGFQSHKHKDLKNKLASVLRWSHRHCIGIFLLTLGLCARLYTRHFYFLHLAAYWPRSFRKAAVLESSWGEFFPLGISLWHLAYFQLGKASLSLLSPSLMLSGTKKRVSSKLCVDMSTPHVPLKIPVS